MVLCPQLKLGSATSRCCTVLFGCAALVGCFGGQVQCDEGGQTGGEYAPGCPVRGTVTDSGCTPKYRALSVDEVSSLGFAAGDVLEYAEGTRSASLFWSANTAPLSYGPESGQGRIELSLQYRGGSVRSVEFDSGTDTSAVACMPSFLEIEVEAALSTAGGALSESFPALLTATSPMAAQLKYTFQLEALNGSFMASVPAGSVVDQLRIDAALNGASFQGNLSSSVSSSSAKEDPRGSTSSSIAITLATWPSAFSGQP